MQIYAKPPYSIIEAFKNLESALVENPYQWNGNTTDLMEIATALSESNLVEGNPTTLFFDLCSIFRIKIDADPKTIRQNMKRRKRQKFRAVRQMYESLTQWDKEQTEKAKYMQKIKRFEALHTTKEAPR